MASLYDSSLLLSGILEPELSPEADAAWSSETIRVASMLLEAECLIAIRRASLREGRSPRGKWAGERIARLEAYFAAVTRKPVDGDILEIIRAKPELSGCRTLDALHLATAFYFQLHLDEPLTVCSLDRRLRELADACGFPVKP